ncbi:MAG TPA: NADH-quinone oxidoreductase subunit C [Actinomycetes bacterium]|nr:NADH-quinone oxidoreductase subunit C [Actinomycetes bacterium]
MSLAQELVAALGVGRVVGDRGDEHADVPATDWLPTATAARDVLGCRWLDFLGAYEDGRPGVAQTVPVVVARLYCRERRAGLLLRTAPPPEDPLLPTLTGVFAGAAWHEREVAEMFGITFTGHPDPRPLLLHGIAGHPLRKSAPLAARAARPWPGAVDPDDAGGRRRRRALLPPGVSEADSR